MDLTILGASGSYPTASCACSGYLLREDGYAVWVDAGNGTMMALQRHVGIADVDAIFLSHVHPDHCADLFPYFFAVLFADLGRTIPVYTPPGLRGELEALIHGQESLDLFRSLFDWYEIEPGDVTESGPFRLEAFDAAHSVKNTSMRITAGGKTLCYSGDTGPNEHLARAAAGADLFLCEASWLEEHRGLMPPIHLTASEAAETARTAGTGRLMLTHIWPDNDLDVVREQASAFEGEVSFAVRTETVTV